MKLSGAAAIVTGASRGLGRAVALRYVTEGARVAICSRTPQDIELVAKEIRRAHGEVLAVKADVSQERDVDRLVSLTLKAFGRIDVLVNNAGVLAPKVPIHDMKVMDWDTTIAVNLRGPFLCIRAVLPGMLERRAGSIINVSSGAGQRPAPRWGPYAVSKFGLEGLNALVAEEARAAGVRVNAVNPGGTRTAMRAQAYPQEDPMRLPQPEQLTGLFVYLASPDSQAPTGTSIDAPQWLAQHPEWQ